MLRVRNTTSRSPWQLPAHALCMDTNGDQTGPCRIQRGMASDGKWETNGTNGQHPSTRSIN